MDTDQLVRFLDDPQASAPWLREWGVSDLNRAHQNLVHLAELGVTLDLLAVICDQLALHLPTVSDPDMALNNLDRVMSNSRTPLSLASLIERDDEALSTLLQILSGSQYLADLIIRNPSSFDVVRMTEGQPVVRDVLIQEIRGETQALTSESSVAQVLREFKHRETLRIAYGDIVRRHTIKTVTEQISYLADAIIEAAVNYAKRALVAKRGIPRLPNGREASFVVLAMGKLGGVELNYSSDVDLIFLCETQGKTESDRPVDNAEFFDRMARLVVKLLTDDTPLGVAYRVDLRLRPNGQQGPIVMGAREALRYYDVSGRTWERQAYVKARPIAGEVDLGARFLSQMESWVYRRYLNRADITGIKALKRRIEQRAKGEPDNIKTGDGGIRDIEFAIQFLQMLNGGELPQIRTGNTLEAVERLAETSCLTIQERSILVENYSFLRKVEHRLQIMFDLQTHSLPESSTEMQRLAIRMGYSNNGAPASAQFEKELNEKRSRNRKILDHLLHDAFSDDSDSDPSSDLILDPEPAEEVIREVLGQYGFTDIPAAYRNLMALGSEKIPFLSTRRCRHFLAAIAPELLAAIAQTPNPDLTLLNLANISDSLGGKGVLWELFSFHAPSLKLCVRLCASSSYLSGILTSNPGMIDELMDSLGLDELEFSTLENILNDLSRGAEDVIPILHSFKNSHHLRVGVRDILGKGDIRQTHRALSDIAEVLLQQVVRREYLKLVGKYGHPTIADGDRAGEWCSPIVVAMGKLGGQEPNYHSDLDLVFLYEGAGQTKPEGRRQKSESTSNQHFFDQLGKRIVKAMTQFGPSGRLYELDSRLRPAGKSGAMAVNLREFVRYFEEGDARLWERQALCKARIVFATDEARRAGEAAIRHVVADLGWSPQLAAEIRAMRYRIEENANRRNLKRGPGGTMDVEFVIQMLQLKHAAAHPEVVVPGTLDAIQALVGIGALRDDEAESLRDAYRFLRSVESRLRLMNATARHDVPHEPAELNGLAFLLGHADASRLVEMCDSMMARTRGLFKSIFERESL